MPSMFARIAFVGLVLVPASLLSAHPGHEHGGVAAGLLHPLHGLDHLLAMMTVGLLAVRAGGRGRWIVPLSFVTVMAGGAMVGLFAPGLIASGVIEPMIIASVLVFGLILAAAPKLDLRWAAAVVGLFALAHGYAHAVESGGHHALAFALGMITGTTLLHAAGLILGSLLLRYAGTITLRAAGGCVTAVFMFALILT